MKTLAVFASLISMCSADWYTWNSWRSMTPTSDARYDTFDAPYVVDSIQQVTASFSVGSGCGSLNTIQLWTPSWGSYTCFGSTCSLTWTGDTNYPSYITFTAPDITGSCSITVQSVTMEYNEGSVNGFAVAWVIIMIGGCITCAIVSLLIYRRRRNRVVLITQTTGAAPLIVANEQGAVAAYPATAYQQPVGYAAQPAGYPAPAGYPQPVVGQPVDYPPPAAGQPVPPPPAC